MEMEASKVARFLTTTATVLRPRQVTVSQARLQEFIRAELSYFAAQHTQAWTESQQATRRVERCISIFGCRKWGRWLLCFTA